MHAIRINEYESLSRYARGFAEGKINLCFVVGRAGTAKTRTIKKALQGTKHCVICGHATAFGMYEKLLAHADQPILIDDVDQLFADRRAVKLLKSLCTTEAVKEVQWNSNAASKEGLPDSFRTTSNVMIVANEWHTKNGDVAALVDRGLLFSFDPTAEAVHEKTGKWFDDDEIYEWFERHLTFFPQLSMRQYLKAKELKSIGDDWRAKSLANMHATEREFVLLQDRYDTQKERIANFSHSRATYFRVQRKMLA